MRDCEAHEAIVSAWLDGEVTREEQVELVDHLVRCESCRSFYRAARSLDGLVALVRTPVGAAEPSPELWKQIERRATSRARPRIGATFLRAAALLAVTAGVAYGLWSMSPPTDVPPASIDVRLGEDRGRMTEARFFELATELMRSDRRYQLAALEVMRQVTDDTLTRESSAETSPGRDGEERAETGARRLPA